VRARDRRHAVRTPAHLAQRQQEIREQLLTILGGLPEPADLQARVTGGFQRTGYRVENVVYDALPGFAVSANLYLPRGRPWPAPAIICPCGHSGKDQEVYQRLGDAKKAEYYRQKSISTPTAP